MSKYYTDERNVQIVVALLKQHGIRKVIASPGSTNITFVRSVQVDPFFEVYSSVDERSAAYMACGLAAESGEPVVISCTGATASRNYLPGLTEAYYRKLPVLAITSTRDISKYGHLEDQVIDRSVIQKDVARLSVTLPTVKDKNDVWECEIKANRAILELKRHGGGPVHINLITKYTLSYTSKELPKVRVINRITFDNEFPCIPQGKVAVFVGSHQSFSQEQTAAIDRFCVAYNAVVLCDHTSSYNGKYKVLFSLTFFQFQLDNSLLIPDTLIHIGEISSFYACFGNVKQVWRLSEDGEVRDTFHKLRYVFEMPEQSFFEHYAESNDYVITNDYLQQWRTQRDELISKIPELPFSNIWIASQMAHRIPKNSVIHFGILNSLRSWNFFELPQTVFSASNVGGFGIDGCVSSLIGASLNNKNKLYFGVVGDLAFFYDMNSIGNRHISNNIRIMVVNNGKGAEFKIGNHVAMQFDDETDEYIAAARHYGNQSPTLVKHYAQDLGFEYLSSYNKHEFELVYEQFLAPKIKEKPILFEVFTNSSDENKAIEIIRQTGINIKGKAKQMVKQVLGEKAAKAFNRIVK
ncbi:MAG: 2-succinyl-5-enolpyruvyl-6-hydroxy-3-cyclohexene-1-carboxylate synthase [Bacteroidales bacterium]|jgi:2-succinyl-5-enolpyruvyl-6-hydroxy-3-cyclohexene-1-carboxylate synthase|nr:2-succinyl-5-enolpyruvyl-6-hydroxy-3-cyclohexene-1-carboxylate synthase [Bacteroidales bacterium]